MLIEDIKQRAVVWTRRDLRSVCFGYQRNIFNELHLSLIKAHSSPRSSHGIRLIVQFIHNEYIYNYNM